MSKSIIHQLALFAFATSFLMISPKESFAERTTWKTVGGWEIILYPDLGGCQAFIPYEGGISFFIGVTSYTGSLNLDMTLMNDNWKSIEDKKQYSVSVIMGNEAPWDLEMEGIKFENTWGMSFSAPVNSEKANRFVNEFMREVAMEWRFNGRQLGYLSLRNSREAFQEAVTCTKSFQMANGDASDPFSAGGKSDKVDPFAN